MLEIINACWMKLRSGSHLPELRLMQEITFSGEYVPCQRTCAGGLAAYGSTKDKLRRSRKRIFLNDVNYSNVFTHQFGFEMVVMGHLLPISCCS